MRIEDRGPKTEDRRPKTEFIGLSRQSSQSSSRPQRLILTSTQQVLLLKPAETATPNLIMPARCREQRSGTCIYSKAETATPSRTMLAKSQKPTQGTYFNFKKLIILSLIIAFLLNSITIFRSTILSDWDVDHDQLSIDPPILSRPSWASLAYRQSYGFFNDISDPNWRRIQQRAQRAHKLVEKEHRLLSGTNRNGPSMWYPNDLEPDFTCPHTARVGGRGDGATWTCDPHRLLEREDCLVYSIGSDGTYEWEDALIDLLGSKHCEIHVIDSRNYVRHGDPELKNIHYHQWGTKSSYDKVFNSKLSHLDLTEKGPKKLVAFQDTLKGFLEENRTIDILKIDCLDKCEWSTYKDWFTADIRQILVKTHGAPYYIGGNEWHSQMLAADFFDAFTAQRYAMFSKVENVDDGGESMEFGFVKLHADFWKEDGIDFSVDRQTTLQLQKLPERLVPMSPPAPFKIPRRLILVAETLISKTEDPVESFFNEARLTDMYKEAWGDPFVPVWLLDILTCNAAIFKAKRELMPVFRAETNVSKQLDMCRVAALYLSGGYQIDVDLEVRSIPNPQDNARLVIAREGDVVSKRFIACEPESATMKMALDNMVELSKQKQTRPDFDLVTEALSLALRVPNRDPSLHDVFVPLESIGSDVSTPWIVTNLPVYSCDNPIPLEMRGPPSPAYKIPRRLIFTHKHNLLETKDPPLLYENVQKTIQTYREAWGDPEASVWFLNNKDCRSAIYAAKPELVTYFDREVHGSWKADICRVAALYLTGGYYFDADMEAVNPWIPDSDVAFATATNPDDTRYFQSFLASERKGRIVEEALDEILLFYEEKKSRSIALIGPDTLNWAIRSVPVSEQGKMVLLKETEAFLNEPDASLRPNAVGCCCNFVIQNPTTKQTLFYSRIVGGGHKCMYRDSREGQAWLAEDALQKKS